jgi:hypothetical protein
MTKGSRVDIAAVGGALLTSCVTKLEDIPQVEVEILVFCATVDEVKADELPTMSERTAPITLSEFTIMSFLFLRICVTI